MVIERTEMVILSEKEYEALRLVQRMVNAICYESECPELKQAAGDTIRALNCFNVFTRTTEK